MNEVLEKLMTELMRLPIESRRQVARLIIDRLGVGGVPNDSTFGVRDSSAGYGESDLQRTLSKEIDGMTSVTLTLPDELVKRAREAGLLSEARLAELISGALSAKPELPTGETNPVQRRLIRRNNRLVVESLPGEKKISDTETREILNKLEW